MLKDGTLLGCGLIVSAGQAFPCLSKASLGRNSYVNISLVLPPNPISVLSFSNVVLHSLNVHLTAGQFGTPYSVCIPSCIPQVPCCRQRLKSKRNRSASCECYSFSRAWVRIDNLGDGLCGVALQCCSKLHQAILCETLPAPGSHLFFRPPLRLAATLSSRLAELCSIQ